MCIREPGLGCCSWAWRKSPCTGTYLTKRVDYMHQKTLQRVRWIYWTTHDVQQLTDLIDEPTRQADRRTLVLAHKEESLHCDDNYRQLSVRCRKALCLLATVILAVRQVRNMQNSSGKRNTENLDYCMECTILSLLLCWLQAWAGFLIS